MKTAVEWLLENLISEPYSEQDFKYNSECWDKALEMEKEQMIDHISFGAGLKKSMEEIVYEKIKNGFEELVKQGKLKNYTNYKSE